MSFLPPELLDLIVNHLHREPATLKTCCVVSKSWVPRARKHLFAHVEFEDSKSHMELWKDTFPDPSNSPAHFTLSLSISGDLPVTAADAGVGGWIRTFQNVEHLRLSYLIPASFIPFHGLWPAVRSLRLTFTATNIFDLICSFPLLEDLALVELHPSAEPGEWDTPSTSPPLTGFLYLRMSWDLHSVVHRLCAFPGGLRFTKITVGFGVGDTEPMMDLVSKCSNTLEYLTIDCLIMRGTPRIPFLDLSKATKLKYLDIRWAGLDVQWITTILQTAESKALQHITIYPATANTIGEGVYRDWQDLDRLLVQSSTFHPILVRVVCRVGNNLRDCAPSLLPELTGRGLVELVDTTHSGARVVIVE